MKIKRGDFFLFKKRYSKKIKNIYNFHFLKDIKKKKKNKCQN